MQTMDMLQVAPAEPAYQNTKTEMKSDKVTNNDKTKDGEEFGDLMKQQYDEEIATNATVSQVQNTVVETVLPNPEVALCEAAVQGLAAQLPQAEGTESSIATMIDGSETALDSESVSSLTAGLNVEGTETGIAKTATTVQSTEVNSENNQAVNAVPTTETAESTNTKSNGQDVESGESELMNQTVPTGNEVKESSAFQRSFGIGAGIQTSSSGETAKAVPLSQVHEEILSNIAQGKDDFEIQLAPRNLGELAIQVSYEGGKAVLSIVCSDPETMQLLAGSSGELATIIESRTGTQTQVVVDHPPQDYTQQHQEKDGNANQQGQEEQKKNSKSETNDFLQQLRLGIA